MQVTIGIKHASRELSLETSDSQEKVLAAVADAETKAVILSDDKGRKVFVPAGSLAYIELGEAEPRPGGFWIRGSPPPPVCSEDAPPPSRTMSGAQKKYENEICRV